MEQYCILGRIGEGAHGIVFQSQARGGEHPALPPSVPLRSPHLPDPCLGHSFCLPVVHLCLPVVHPGVPPLLLPAEGGLPSCGQLPTVLSAGSASSLAWISLSCLPSSQPVGPDFPQHGLRVRSTPTEDLNSRRRTPFSQPGRAGSVCAFCPKQTGEIVALKKVACGGWRMAFPTQVLREIKGPAGDRRQSVCEWGWCSEGIPALLAHSHSGPCGHCVSLFASSPLNSLPFLSTFIHPVISFLLLPSYSSFISCLLVHSLTEVSFFLKTYNDF